MPKKRKAMQSRNSDELSLPTDQEQEIAAALLNPSNSTAPLMELISQGDWGKQSMLAFSDALWRETRAAVGGDLKTQGEMLASQSFALHSIFTELARRAALNMGGSLDAVEIYMRLALKAQAQSRTTIEALERLMNGRQQTVRHVHVNHGGKALIAEQINHYPGGTQNGEGHEQSYATGATGASRALPRADENWNGVPISGGQRTKPLPDARRNKSRPAPG